MIKTKDWLPEEDYNFIFKRVPRACLDVMLVNSDLGTLLIKRDVTPHKGKWHMPGGQIRMNESIDDAIRRIVRGEVGITVSPKDRCSVGYIEFFKERGWRHSISNIFLVPIGTNAGKKGAKFFKKIPNNTHPQHLKLLEGRL